jgi:homoserine dehydrogenase
MRREPDNQANSQLTTRNSQRSGSGLRIVQFGLGGVGQALVRHYLNVAERHTGLSYVAISDRSGLCWVEGGWTVEDLERALESKRRGQLLAGLARKLGDRAQMFPTRDAGLPSLEPVSQSLQPAGEGETVVVDVTAERGAYDTLLQARRKGAHIVMCNKWALAENSACYDELFAPGTGSGRILYETTVGAALPVIGTLDRLIETGDEVQAIEAAISGTLGFVCSQIQRGVRFSEALREASRLGYTEPDPRDDLAGIDARRKALILARRLGLRMDMDDVQVESLVPKELEKVGLDEFWRRLPAQDELYAGWVEDAANRGNVLRFLAHIDGSGATVSLQETPAGSLAGSLNDTESLFVFHTRRYGNQPLAVRGRGAGAEVTAGGVLADILSLER